MKLKEKLNELGILKTFDEVGFDSNLIFSGLTEETENLYAQYEWINLEGMGVHAIPPADLLAAGYAWEEWYNMPEYPEHTLQHHILFLKKTDKCTETYDCAPDAEGYPDSVRGKFWYLYNDEDSRLLNAR